MTERRTAITDRVVQEELSEEMTSEQQKPECDEEYGLEISRGNDFQIDATANTERMRWE